MTNNKSNIVGTLSVMLMLLMSSGSTSFFSGFISLLMLFILVLFGNIRLIERNRYILKSFYILIVLIVVYFVGILAIYNVSPNYVFFGRYIISFSLVSILVGIYKKDFFLYLEKSIFVLVLISLVLFIVQLFLFSTIYSFVEGFYSNLPGETSTIYAVNRRYFGSIIIYTINQGSSSFLEQRNSGFAFEPGYFSFFINLGLLFTLITKGLTNKKRIMIYIVALITTFSTTGILGLLIVILIFYFNSKTFIKLIFIPAILAIVVVFFNISFGYDKLESTIVDRKYANEYEEIASANKAHLVSMGRFTGFLYYADKVWQESPLFGLSGLGWKHSINIGVANGTAHFIRNFGFLGLILMLIGTFLSAKVIFRQILNAKYPFYFFLFIQLYLFAFPFSNLPIFWVFLVSAIVIPSRNKNILVSRNAYPINQSLISEFK